MHKWHSWRSWSKESWLKKLHRYCKCFLIENHNLPTFKSSVQRKGTYSQSFPSAATLWWQRKCKFHEYPWLPQPNSYPPLLFLIYLVHGMLIVSRKFPSRIAINAFSFIQIRHSLSRAVSFSGSSASRISQTIVSTWCLAFLRFSFFWFLLCVTEQAYSSSTPILKHACIHLNWEENKCYVKKDISWTWNNHNVKRTQWLNLHLNFGVRKGTVAWYFPPSGLHTHFQIIHMQMNFSYCKSVYFDPCRHVWCLYPWDCTTGMGYERQLEFITP